MAMVNKNSQPLDAMTDEQLSALVKSNDALDQEEARIIKEQIEEEERKKNAYKPFRRLRRSPVEIVNRSLFFIFIGSFIASFSSIYAENRYLFFLYMISAFSCIMYTPNRKALKELLDAWPNIEDLLKKRSVWIK